MNSRLFDFTGFTEFYRLLKPLSPYGRQALQSLPWHTRREDLEAWYDRVDLLLEYRRGSRELKDRLEYHLRRLPEIPSPEEEAFSSDDLFLFKRYLYNLKALSDLLPPEVRTAFHLEFTLGDLLSRLSVDGSQESFQIADAYSPRIALLRKELRLLDQEITALRRRRCEDIREQTGLDFLMKDFIILDPRRAGGIPTDLIYREPYDSRSFILRPTMTEEYYDRYSRRDDLAEEELEEERGILKALGTLVSEHREPLKNCREAVTDFEKAWIVASAAEEYGMVRPRLLSPGSPPFVARGRCLPLELECSNRGVDYQSLDFSPATGISVIRGPNMGGKTTLLKTLGFFQLLSQQGFFIPAEECRLSLFDSLHLVAPQRGDTGGQGLSGYGQEVLSLAEALDSPGDHRLFLIDEFGSTTTSRDARALNEALLEILAQRGLNAFLATHILDLCLPSGVSVYRMAGLRQGGLESLSEAGRGENLENRIRLLNKNMIYTPEPETEKDRGSDALIIADYLGLDAELLRRASKKMGL
ncbi:MAG: hypothetical protein JW760_13040 [Spirochaetales bacterium]|nr:hypothetical protein [Spirochaetales bacterium]